MLLSEIFDNTFSTVRTQWSGDMGQFELDGYTYYINFLRMSPSDIIHQTAPPNSPMSKHTYFIGFAAMDNETGEITDEETNLGNSIQVFSIILNEIKKRVQQTNADILYFGNYKGSKKEPLYRKLIRKYTVNGWEVHSEYDSRFNGQPIHTWILVRN